MSCLEWQRLLPLHRRAALQGGLEGRPAGGVSKKHTMKGIVDYRFGTLTWPDGDSYVGAWEGGLRQGWGAYYWNNGNSYQVGNFQ